MNSYRITTYLIFFSITFFIFLGMHLYVYFCLNRFFGFTRPKTILLVFTVLALSFPLCSILERYYPNSISMILYAAASTWLGTLFLLLTAFLLYEPVRLIVNLDSKTTGMVLISSVLLISLYALICGQLITVKTVDIPLPKLQKPLKIVQLSDIHVGTIHNSGFLSRIVKKTNTLKPDMVVITGDLFDGIGTINRHTVEPLRRLNTKTFFVTGNHERYSDMNQVAELMAENNVIILRNRVVDIFGIQLVGTDYPERENQKENPYLKELTIKQAIPSVLLYHAPSGIEDALEAGIDLQISGHTHNGQIFPFNLLARLFFPYINGLYKIENMYLYVSPGSGTWGPPMRLGSSNQITLINLILK